MIQHSNLGRGEISYPNGPDRLWGPTRVSGSLPGVKQPNLHVDRSRSPHTGRSLMRNANRPLFWCLHGAKGEIFHFLGLFVKLRKWTITFSMSVRPSACNNSAPTGRIFMKFVTWIFWGEYLSINSSFIKIWQEWRSLYMKFYIHLW